MNQLIAGCAIALLAMGCGSDSGSTAAVSDDGAVGDDATVAETAGETVAPEPDTAPPEVTAPPELTSLDLVMDQDVQMVLGLSSFLEIGVPEDAIAVTISILGGEATYYGLSDWIAPDGFELVTRGWVNGEEGQGGLCFSCNNRIALSAGAFATIAPNNPSAHLSPGTHKFSLFGYVPPAVEQSQGPCGDGICHFIDQFQCPQDCRPEPAAGAVRVMVHVKRAAAGLPDSGVLDLNLHFSGAQGLTAESAQTDASFQGWLESMRAIYQQVGIALGEITYRDVDPAYQVIETLDGVDSDLQAMFSESDADSDAANLFFVDELSADALGGFGVILGIAGGIPGPIAQGSWRSGVAIAIKPIPGAPAGVDTTMAHEMGHYLGLFHTSEQAFFGPQLHDPLPDTPDNDASYLMFNTGSGDKLSEWQGRVMRSNPWVRHPAAETSP